MSNSNQAAVVGGGGILTVGGRTFVVRKPSARDLVLMQKWLMSQPLKHQGGLTEDDLKNLSPEHQMMLIREFAKVSKTRRAPTEAEAMEMVLSPAGVAMQLWLAARWDQPGLTQEEIRKLITEDNVTDVIVDLDEAVRADPTGGESDDPKAPGGTT